MTKNIHTKLLAAEHTGKLRPHKHTSYGALALILLLAFMPLMIISHSAAADSNLSGSGSYELYAVVPAPVPSTAPTITSPTNGQVFTGSAQVSIQGQCANHTLVEIFKNQIMSGASTCAEGAYDISTDLFIGINSIVAQAFNADNESGPQSNPVTVKFLPPGVTLSGASEYNVLGAPVNQLYVTADIFYSGSQAGSSMSWPITITGGQAPYAVSIGWGDGNTDLFVQDTPGQFNISHTYDSPSGERGSYPITIKVTDQAGNQSYLQVMAIVSGKTKTSGIAGVVGNGYNTSGLLRVAWQLLGVLIVIVLSFWIGERREARILRRQANTTLTHTV